MIIPDLIDSDKIYQVSVSISSNMTFNFTWILIPICVVRDKGSGDKGKETSFLIQLIILFLNKYFK